MLQSEGGRVYAYVTDHLGTPRELVDPEGRVAWAVAHTAWGQVHEVWRDPAAKVAVESPFRLLGQYGDQETGLAYTRYRYFEAETGRWLSPDPIGVAGGKNLLGFDGAPTDAIDPLGLRCDGLPANAPKATNSNVKRIVRHRDGSVTYEFHDGFRVTYKAKGFPDFAPHSMRRNGEPVAVRIKYTGDRDKDFAAARAAAGLTKGETAGYTWHHVEDVRVTKDGTYGTMLLVRTDVHEQATHRGGVSVHKARGGGGYEGADD
jgi:RHS repeat-associated protein